MNTERAPLTANLDASIIKGGDIVREMALAEGFYNVECIRPKPGLERLYEPLWRRKASLENMPHEGFRLSPLQADDLAFLKRRMAPMEQVIWRDTIHNVVCTAGKNLALDTILAGAAYTVVGPFLGLISSISYTATAAADTQASHAGWTEAGVTNAPTYTVPRKTAVFSAASAGAKALSAALSFAITGSGTVKGAFVIFGTGAVATVDSAAGVLLSAGAFSGGDKIVANLDTLNVSWSLAL